MPYMGVLGTHGDHAEINAVCNIHEKCIVAHNSCKVYLVHHNEFSQPNDIVYLDYTGDGMKGHYNALITVSAHEMNPTPGAPTEIIGEIYNICMPAEIIASKNSGKNVTISKKKYFNL